jgi:hypothetical protein
MRNPHLRGPATAFTAENIVKTGESSDSIRLKCSGHPGQSHKSSRSQQKSAVKGGERLVAQRNEDVISLFVLGAHLYEG